MTASLVAYDRKILVVIESWADDINMHPQTVNALLEELGDKKAQLSQHMHVTRADYLIQAIYRMVQS